jgi:signal peptidase I
MMHSIALMPRLRNRSPDFQLPLTRMGGIIDELTGEIAGGNVMTRPDAPPPRPRLQQAPFRDIFDTVLWVALMFTLVNLATGRFVVEGQSMFPNFDTGQYILVSRVHYLIGDPVRGDIVVFHSPGNPNQDFIKRVIGVPGDTVEIRAQQVYVNGELLDEPYINEFCTTCMNNTWSVGPDQFFVMGDNRNRSSDSRGFGAIDRSLIVGEAILRYLPVNNISTVDSIAYPK